MMHIVLYKPEHPGNIGAVCRVMKNFGFKDLVLVEPCAIIQDTHNRAKHAQNVLDNAKHVSVKEFLVMFDFYIGTTGKLGSDYNVPRSPVTPDELHTLCDRKANVALVFGPEGKGLSNALLKKMDATVTIPTAKEYTVLNLSHAVAIVLYDLFRSSALNGSSVSHIQRASGKDKEVTLEYFDKVLDELNFSTTDKKKTQDIVWKRLIGKGFMTKREAFAVIGFFKKVLERMK
jgi:tRNA/rRNA methyltransferase